MLDFDVYDKYLEDKYLKERIAHYIGTKVGDLDLPSESGNQKIRCIFDTHEDEDPSFTIYFKGESTHFFCFGCERYGDIFDLIGYFEGIQGDDARRLRAKELYGDYRKNKMWCSIQQGEEADKLKNREELEKRLTEARETVEEAQANFAQEPIEAVEYLKSRGLDYEFCKSQGVGYRNRQILICDEGTYIARNIPPLYNGQQKYLLPKGVPAHIFNSRHLRDDSIDVIFVVEGTFDMLSIEQAGFKAVAFSPVYIKKFLEELDRVGVKKSLNKLFILSMDNDKKKCSSQDDEKYEGTGQRANAKLLSEMTSRGYLAVDANVGGTHVDDPKDANEALVKLGADEFKNRLTTIVEKAKARVPQLINQMTFAEKEKYPFGEITLSDMGNAQHFVNMFSGHIRYCADQDQWYIYNGKRWEADSKLGILEKAKSVPNRIAMCLTSTSGEGKKTWGSHVNSSRSESRIRALINLAKSDPNIVINSSDLDSAPNLLNVRNGIIDLKRGALMPHRPEYFITKYIDIDYNPEAHFDSWDSFIKYATKGDEEYIGYIQRAIGYSVTGETNEQAMFFLYGDTSTGKSTFIRAIKSVLADYTKAADSSILMKKNINFAGSHSDELAALEGVRLVDCEEVSDGAGFSAELIKRITGEGDISCRALYKKTSTYKPVMKFWLVGNHRPEYDALDQAVTRRLFMVPFDRRVPEEEVDRHLFSKLTTKEGKEAILAMVIKGAGEWYKSNLGKCTRSEASRTDYVDDIDWIQQFINDNIIFSADSKVSKADVYRRYTEWAESCGYKRVCASNLYDRLRQKGLMETRKSTGRFFEGIRLMEPNVGGNIDAGTSSPQESPSCTEDIDKLLQSIS